MDRLEAIEKLMLQPRNRRTLERLLSWDPQKTLQENANALTGGEQSTARQLAFRFKLGFSKVRFNSSYYNGHKREKEIRRKWDETKTLKENAKLIGVKQEHASIISRRMGLGYTKKLKKRSYVYVPRRTVSVQNPQNLQALALRNLGFSYKAIAETLGIGSRQQAEQIVKNLNPQI